MDQHNGASSKRRLAGSGKSQPGIGCLERRRGADFESTRLAARRGVDWRAPARHRYRRLLAINENNRVKAITERALSFDIEVEDEASDVLVAVLELRHTHRNIVFSGPSGVEPR